MLLAISEYKRCHKVIHAKLNLMRPNARSTNNSVRFRSPRPQTQFSNTLRFNIFDPKPYTIYHAFKLDFQN